MDDSDRVSLLARRILLIIACAGGLTVLFVGLPEFVQPPSTSSSSSRMATSFSSPKELSGGDKQQIKREAGSLNPLQSLIITRSDSTVLSFHRNGFGPNEAVNIKSASKSVLSALVGITLRDGHLTSLDQPLTDFFPELLKNASGSKQQITLRHVLEMRSGLESTSFENYGPWVTSNNWLRDALDRPIVDPPGTETNYSTGNSHIIAAVLTEVTDRDLLDYANEKLFNPIGTSIRDWQRSPEGYRFGGNNLSLTTEGMVKFGQLYLNDGRWNGRQIIPADWVKRSTRRIIHDTHNGYPYGYFWWNTRYHGLDVKFAWGHGGQFVFVIPRLNMVVVTTSDLQSVTGTDGYTEKIHEMLKNEILRPSLETG